jgi:hypothetical protein
LAFLTHNKAKVRKMLIITMVFEKNANFFCRKLAKIAENCDHNIDPWLFSGPSKETYLFILLLRRLLIALDAETPAPESGHDAPQHHLPDVRLSARLRSLVLPQRRDLLHRQDRRLHPLQLRVSTSDCTSGSVLWSLFSAISIQKWPKMAKNGQK